MADQRILSPTATVPDEDEQTLSLRPSSMDQYIGQEEMVNRLRIAIEAAKQRNEPLDHVLLHGPPGLGKTTLAHVIAHEMNSRVHMTSGPALNKGMDLVGVLTRIEARDVLFIDEIHRMPISVEEFVYPAMEDFRIDVRTESGPHARTVQIACKPFTLIGATTRAGLLSSPLRSRFGIVHHIRYYEPAELRAIVHRNAQLLDMPMADDGCIDLIASRSRGTPRIANRLLRRVRDFAQVRANGSTDAKVVEDALGLEGVDALGLDELDRKYLRAIAGVYQGGPVGLEAIAATMNEDAGTLEDVVEPYLLQIGFLARTRRGRMMTRSAADHLHLKITLPDDQSLFSAE
ncbi:MAG: Holliday junction branch migration DNA helicase RuvB [Phycisphaerales bacterium]|nr:Holliday junction branch migration DNA helicase RuvB [Phycisphaerales bacterium]